MFIYKEWDSFCKSLNNYGIKTVSAESVIYGDMDSKFIILKHDVETNPKKALKMAKIETKYSLRGSYYIQAYLLKNRKNIKILKEIQLLGHEVSYHHDVMDSNGGDINKADLEFSRNLNIFRNEGFNVRTVCQHGNPIVKRIGYYSNRDFFRNKNISNKYSDISEIMVNFKEKIGSSYKYISDAGYGWKVIFDPENNDIIDSEDKDISLETLDKVLDEISVGDNIIISTHPHRWQNNIVFAYIKNYVYKFVKKTAKFAMKSSYVKSIMEKFYFIAKKV